MKYFRVFHITCPKIKENPPKKALEKGLQVNIEMMVSMSLTDKNVMDLVSGCHDCTDNCVKIDNKTRKECVLHLKKLGMDLDKDHLRARGTALQIACMDGAAHMTQMLIEAGADINKTDRLGQGPLHYAASSGHSQIVK